jgi:hypothetical protein
MTFFKHVGVANNKKVIIIQRQLAGDDAHMAAILYSDILPSRYHDDVMQVLESTEGQQAYEFRDILQRRMMADGNNMLQALSNENYIKRVAQSAIIVKPNSKSSIRLDELNKLLNEAGRGEQAVKKLEEMDASLGLNADPSKSNAARNAAKVNAINTADGPDTIHYGDDIPVVAAPVAAATDSTQMMMMEMMKTMQAMQKEIASMKKTSAADKKAAKAKSTV